jgi:hypothetical protein
VESRYSSEHHNNQDDYAARLAQDARDLEAEVSLEECQLGDASYHLFDASSSSVLSVLISLFDPTEDVFDEADIAGIASEQEMAKMQKKRPSSVERFKLQQILNALPQNHSLRAAMARIVDNGEMVDDLDGRPA